MVAISASVGPASASRVTAVPRKSLKMTPTVPALALALAKDARKPSGRPGFAFGVEQDDWAQAWRGVQSGLERGANRDAHTRAGFALFETNCPSVIG